MGLLGSQIGQWGVGVREGQVASETGEWVQGPMGWQKHAAPSEGGRSGGWEHPFPKSDSKVSS